MTSRTLVLVTFQFAALCCNAADSFAVQTSDGITVHGDVYMVAENALNAPLILLFHQGGGDSRGEYGPIVPILLEDGYNVIAIDQRRGGDRFQGDNRTLAALGDAEYGYCDVMPDLEAALSYSRQRGFDGPTAAWGSSYSATLAIKLAAERPDEIDAVLAFSPASGEPMAGCAPEQYSAAVTRPVLVLRPASEMQIERVAGQLAVFKEQGHETYVADPGVHGSSMLVESRVGAPVDQTWSTVRSFLRNALPTGH